MSARDHNQSLILREELEFRRKQHALRVERIKHIARENPELSIEALCERFNEDEKVMRRIVGPRPRDLFLSRDEVRRANASGGGFFDLGWRTRRAR